MAARSGSCWWATSLGAPRGAAAGGGGGGAAAAAAAESTESALDRLLGGGGGRAAAQPPRAADSSAAGAVQSLIDSVVRPHVTRDVSERRALVLGAVDEV